MQPCSREMQGLNSLFDNNTQQQQIQMNNLGDHMDPIVPSASHDDFLKHMLSSLPNSSSSTSFWPDHLNPPSNSDETPPSPLHNVASFTYDDHAALASKFRNHQITPTSSSGKPTSAAALMLHHHLLMSRGAVSAADSALLQMPLSLPAAGNDVVDGSSSFKSPNPAGEGSVQALFNGFTGSLQGTAIASNQTHHFQHPQVPLKKTYNYLIVSYNYYIVIFIFLLFWNLNERVREVQIRCRGRVLEVQAAEETRVREVGTRVSRSRGLGPGEVKLRTHTASLRGICVVVYVFVGQLRRERIAERMKALQELVPNANKTDKASMLDEIIDYVKFLQLQVKVLSMSRLGGAAAVAPLVADITSEGGGDCLQTNGGRNQTTPSSSSNDNSLTMTEHQVAKLMEEDMGSAMQYLQGKGLCLMPISLATAISTATCHARNPLINNNQVIASNGDGPSSPGMSVLTVQSGTLGNGDAVKDAASVSKP